MISHSAHPCSPLCLHCHTSENDPNTDPAVEAFPLNTRVSSHSHLATREDHFRYGEHSPSDAPLLMQINKTEARGLDRVNNVGHVDRFVNKYTTVVPEFKQ